MPPRPPRPRPPAPHPPPRPRRPAPGSAGSTSAPPRRSRCTMLVERTNKTGPLPRQRPGFVYAYLELLRLFDHNRRIVKPGELDGRVGLACRGVGLSLYLHNVIGGLVDPDLAGDVAG